MTITIFHTENNSSEEWLEIDDDGTLTHHIENSGWPMARAGLLSRKKNMTAQAAKERWPPYAEKIDQAITQLVTSK